MERFVENQLSQLKSHFASCFFINACLENDQKNLHKESLQKCRMVILSAPYALTNIKMMKDFPKLLVIMYSMKNVLKYGSK